MLDYTRKNESSVCREIKAILKTFTVDSQFISSSSSLKIRGAGLVLSDVIKKMGKQKEKMRKYRKNMGKYGKIWEISGKIWET